MRFEEVLPHLRAGKRVRRKLSGARVVIPTGLLDDDWELVTEAPKSAGEALFYGLNHPSVFCCTWDEPSAKSTRAECERAAQAVIAWHEAQNPQKTALDDPEWHRDNGPGKPLEPKSLGQIAWEAFPGGYYSWASVGVCDRDEWEAAAQAVRAEVLKEAHRELTGDEYYDVYAAFGEAETRENWPNVRAAIRKADELRAKR